jgi:hypothetical protein
LREEDENIKAESVGRVREDLVGRNVGYLLDKSLCGNIGRAGDRGKRKPSSKERRLKSPLQAEFLQSLPGRWRKFPDAHLCDAGKELLEDSTLLKTIDRRAS